LSVIHLHPNDQIAVATRDLQPGETISIDGIALAVSDRIPVGHKLALTPIAAECPILKFGQTIGYATRAIHPGQWVHTHNVTAGELHLEHEFCSAIPAAPTPVTGRTFQGYHRANGKVATRNYIGIISTVNCSATTSKYISQNFPSELLAEYPNIDGVVALMHKGGCAMQYGGADHRQLTRTLAGCARHPNIAAYIVVGLGCETAQASFLMENEGLIQLGTPSRSPGRAPLVLTIQDEGGVKKTVARATAAIKELLPEVAALQRTPAPVSEIMLGLECGGSDGNSGVTANPALGVCADLLVAHGATAVLSETPEIYGGEHLLTRRAKSPAVARKLMERIQWWLDYTAKFGERLDINPSVGNKQGGLTTIYEKSLGAIAKGGTTALNAVYEYAETITERGFVFMDTPGYDPASVTGLVAGGANVVVFTTGRGSCFGCKPVPTIKVTSNTRLYERMIDDMDFDAGRILAGDSVQQVGHDLFEEVIAVASGQQTKSEAQGIGDEEFCPWTWGPVT
jgi:altronate hydrolase